MKGKVWNITDMEDLKEAAREVLKEMGGLRIKGASVLALYGDLGSGKTTFTQALGAELGIEEDILSPTFVIMKRYELKEGPWRSCVHIDAYRLESEEELRVLGFMDWLQEEGTLIVIEWADRIESLLPEASARLKFTLEAEKRTLKALSL